MGFKGNGEGELLFVNFEGAPHIQCDALETPKNVTRIAVSEKARALDYHSEMQLLLVGCANGNILKYERNRDLVSCKGEEEPL